MRTFLFLLLLISNTSFGQTYAKRKSVFFEIAGSGGIGSINYEKLLCKKNNIEYTGRLGFSIAPIDKNNGIGLVFPFMVNSIFGKHSHKLELGIGQGLTVTTKGSFFLLTIPTIGYRYQNEKKKMFYRVTYTPLISCLIDFQVQQWAGISIGCTLNNKAK
jgi:hypothetical protein